MNKVFFVALFGFLAIQAISAKPKGKQAAGADNELNELAANVQKIVTNATVAFQENLPTSKQIIDTITNTGANITTSIENTIEKLNKAVKDHEGDLSDFLKGVSTKLSEARDTIKSAIGPDAQKKANELREQFEKGLKEASAQGEKLVNAISPQASKMKDDLRDLTKSFLDNLLEQTKNLKQQIETTKTN